MRSERAATTTFLEELRNAVWSVNANLNPATIRTLGDLVDRSFARTSMTLELLAITGSIALLLGLVGVYGMVGYVISQRHREIGVRLALGARPGEVRRMFVRRALVPVGFGVAVGLAAAAGLTRIMKSQLFGVSPLDPLTHLAVMLVLVVAAWLASNLSARRASALDPVKALRGD
jgi:ABC-type antimicrobial peptide transport system permease subunit